MAWIQSQKNETEQAEGFYRYWVLKESFIKAIRLGMKQDLREFEIALDERGARLVRQPEAVLGTYYYQEYQPDAVQKRNLVNFIILTNEISFDKILYGKNIGLSRNL